MTARLVGISVVWIPLAFLTDGITVLVLPLILGADASAIGLASFAGLATGVLVQLAAGPLSDRIRGRLDRRAFIAIASVPALAGLALIAGGVAAVAAYVLVQVGAGAVGAGQGALIPEAVEPSARGRASGLKTAFDVGGSFLAFLVLGALLSGGDVRLAAVTSATGLVAAIALLWWLVPAIGRTDDARTTSRPLTLPPGFLPLVVSRFLLLLGTYAVGRFLVLLVADRTAQAIGGAVVDAGGLLALFTLVTAAAALPAGWAADRVGAELPMVAGAVACAAGTLALVPDAGLAGVIAGGLVMSLGTASFVSANWAATTRLVRASDAGGLMAIANVGTGLAAAAAGLLGPLIDAAGYSAVLAVAAAAAIAAIVPIVRFSPTRTVPEATT